MLTATSFPRVKIAAPQHILLLCAAWAAILLLFMRDALALAGIWWSSSTFTHCLLIPPIIAWLVAQRWPQLRLLKPRGWLPGLILVSAGAVSWLLGDAAGVAFARHLGLILMLQGSVVTLLGPEVSRGLMFPLAYMFFLVPAGEALVPPLQTLTAKICMALLSLSGIPAHIDGVFITIPNGWFEVAEACSGAKFLLAMAAYGTLVANVCFRSWPRRIAFMVAALVLPVLANGVRAWGTIYMAHRTNAHFAEGFDHVIYGWVFFGIVIALLIAGSWRWFDRKVGDPWIVPARLQQPQGATDAWKPGFAGAILIPLVALLWSLVASAGRVQLPAITSLPMVSGWQQIAAPPDWRPNFAGADRLLIARYVDGRGRAVDLAVAIFTSQAEGRELVGYGQGAVAPDSHWAWTDDRPAPPRSRAFRITGPGDIVRDVITFYRIGSITTGNEFRVKAETLKTKLLGGPKRAVAILVSAPENAGHGAWPAMIDLLQAIGPVDQLADRMSGQAG
jgi:exosortase A